MAGFFLYTGQEAVIKSLTIDSSCHIMAGSHVAALVSQNNGTIVNCRNNARVTGPVSYTHLDVYKRQLNTPYFVLCT